MGIPSEVMKSAGELASDHKGLAIGAVAIGATLGAGQIAAVVLGAHGETSHQANGQGDRLRKLNDWSMWLLTVDKKMWASAHVGDVQVDGQLEGIMHHGMTDANIYPTYEIENYLRTIEPDPEKYDGFPTLPENELIPNLDPAAEFTHEEVRRIGSFAYDIVEDVLGDQHEPPTEYTREEASTVLDTSKPRYTYGPAERQPTDAEYTSADKAKILLADPYSPALEPIDGNFRNGAKAIEKNNVKRFQAPADFFRRHPELVRPMLRNAESTAPDNKLGPAVLYGGAIVGLTAYNVARRGLSIKSLVTGFAAGAASGTMAIRAPIRGGKEVNAYGHDGPLTLTDLVKLKLNRRHKLEINEDGSYMTTLKGGTKVGKAILRALDVGFAGELTGQPGHHAKPGDRLYSLRKGFRRVIDNPATAAIKGAAVRSWMGLRPGNGFDLQEGERRPDEVNSIITDVIQPARVRTVYPELSKQQDNARFAIVA